MPGFGSLFYFGERLLLSCKGIQTDEHSHYSASIIFSKNKPFFVHKKSEIIETEGIILPPNFFHKLEAKDIEIFVIQLDPKSNEFKKLNVTETPYFIPKATKESIVALSNPLLTEDINCTRAKRIYQSILSQLGSESELFREIDPRILLAIQLIRSKLPESITLSEISEKTGISKDRFMHLFKDNMGIPLRQYLLWKRLHIAAKHLQDGFNLTESSHAAGFSDQAHLSRTFKKMFGVKPSLFLGTQTLKTVCFCDEN